VWVNHQFRYLSPDFGYFQILCFTFHPYKIVDALEMGLPTGLELGFFSAMACLWFVSMEFAYAFFEYVNKL
jgi:hypothetical protein